MEYQRASAATACTKKLSSNGHTNSFNGKNVYDGVFGGQSKVGSRVEDYAEIFGGSGSGSSIPFLDVPELNQRKFSVDVSSSKLDYSNIFGTFGDTHFAVSHDEFVSKPTRDKKRPAKTQSYSEGTFSNPLNNPMGNQVLSNDQTPHGSSNGVKQFKMSYNKSSPLSKNGTNGMIHVAVPSYTCVVDEKVTPHREKPVSSVVNEPYENKFGEGKRDGIHVQPCGAGKQTLKGVDQLDGEIKSDGSDCNDVLFGSFDFGHRIPPLKVTRASSMSYDKCVNKRDPLKFGVSRSQSLDCHAGVSSPPYFDDELDANSVAATSAAAVKKAIDEAQASLKVAREIMERRKGHVGWAKLSFNGSSRGEERKKGKDSVKQNNFREDKAQESSEKIDASLQTSDGVNMQNVLKVRQVANESENGERDFIAREVAGETCANNRVSSQADCRQEVGKREPVKEKDVNQDRNEHEGEDNEVIEKPHVILEATQQERKLDASKEFCVKEEEYLHKQMPDVEFHDPKEDEAKLRFVELQEETEEKVCDKLETCEKKLKDSEKPIDDEGKVETQELKDTDNVERQRVDQEVIDMEHKSKHIIEVNENSYAFKDVSEKEENEMPLREDSTQKEFNKISEEPFEISELKEEHEVTYGPEEINEEEDACNREDNEQMSDKMEPEKIDLGDNTCDHEEEIGDSLGNEEFVEAEENGDLFEDAYQMETADEVQKEACEISELKEEHEVTYGPEEINEEEDACNREDNEQMSDKMEPEIIDLGDNTCDHEEEIGDSLGNEEFVEAEENGDLFEDAYQMETADEVQKEACEIMGTEEVQKQTVQEADEMTETREDALDCYWEDLEVADDIYNEDKFNNLGQNSEPSSNADSCEMSQELLLNEENGEIAEGWCKETRRDTEVASDLEESLAFDKSDLAESNLKPNEIKQQAENTTNAFNLDSSIDVDTADITFEKDQYEQYSKKLEKTFTVEKHVEELACESEDVREGEFSLKQEENKNDFEHSDEVTLVDSQLHCEFGEKYEATQITHEIEAGQSTEHEEESCPQISMKEERDTENSSQEEVKLVNEEQKRADEAKERERQKGRGKEKQKERIAVGRVIREARERAFAEARERAAAGRANIEAQRKVKAQAQGESTKLSAEANDKTFMEAKLKAERAAVERATAEARQRALEKALSEKASQSYDSQQKSSCPPATSRYHTSSNQSATKYSEGLDGTAGESVQRCKARSERHQRTSERAAKALAEKNEYDLLAQKEQAERNRLAETLDAEVKRWSSGKQGNLRALLSTLQYILGPDSGWQAIPLTDIIATAAVKKAYRKATLCVHPDKLQQRGATIQQKYICEKVFDLIKEAWNRFSAEER